MVMADHAVEHALARDAQSVRHARLLISDALRDDDRALPLDTALLLVSELVGNAVRYGEEPITMDLARGADGLVVGVSDASPSMPAMPPPAPSVRVNRSDDPPDLPADEPVGGRGLRLIETLADEWDVEKRERGKRVWFLLRPSHR